MKIRNEYTMVECIGIKMNWWLLKYGCAKICCVLFAVFWCVTSPPLIILGSMCMYSGDYTNCNSKTGSIAMVAVGATLTSFSLVSIILIITSYCSDHIDEYDTEMLGADRIVACPMIHHTYINPAINIS